MPGAPFYNILYWIGAPWGGGPRPELVRLVESGSVNPSTYPRALDLGCGEGEDALFLASQGFDVVGLDFSRRAIEHARAKALKRGLGARCRFVEGDITAESIVGVEGPFDFLFDGGSIDDLQGAQRVAAARMAARRARPGTKFLSWCFYGARSELPRISFVGPSRLASGIEPGEMERLYGDDFDIERIDPPGHRGRWACFLLTRKPHRAALLRKKEGDSRHDSPDVDPQR